MKWTDVLRYASQENLQPDKRVVKSDEDWKQVLTEEQFHITRQKGTERAFTGEYCHSHEPGLYACVCCNTPLFDARQKFESGSGWPSFTEPVKNNVIHYQLDNTYGMQRVEVMCNVCDCHLGHVFPDGPEPTGLRFCINSVSIKRISDKEN